MYSYSSGYNNIMPNQLPNVALSNGRYANVTILFCRPWIELLAVPVSDLRQVPLRAVPQRGAGDRTVGIPAGHGRPDAADRLGHPVLRMEGRYDARGRVVVPESYFGGANETNSREERKQQE